MTDPASARPRPLNPAWNALGITLSHALGDLMRNCPGFGLSEVGLALRLLIPMDWPRPYGSLGYPDEDPDAATVFMIPVERCPHVRAPVLGLVLDVPGVSPPVN